MILERLTKEHRHCDELFAQAEELAATGDAEKARDTFEDFTSATEEHFELEENHLFPAIEKNNGPVGPTQVMRTEHEQMRTQIQTMLLLLEAGDCEEFLDQSETFLILMQQHNLKEESILYPMADQLLPDGI